MQNTNLDSESLTHGSTAAHIVARQQIRWITLSHAIKVAQLSSAT
jgi:hypothetical protein